MRVDSARTRKAVDAINRDLVQASLAAHQGRQLRELEGRAVLEFPDTRNAVLFAVTMQLALLARNKNIRTDRQIQFRIGIDKVQQEGLEAAEQIAYGLMELAEPGGICISETVRNEASSGLDLTIEPVGSAMLNAIPDTTSAYEIILNEKSRSAAVDGQQRDKQPMRVILTAGLAAVVLAAIVVVAGIWIWGGERSSRVTTASQTQLFDRPSIAVLPFDSVTTNPEGAMFAHGITVSIISALSEVPQIAVISSSAAFAVAEQSQAPQAAGAELGVEYVLTGSVQLRDNQIRVIAELSDVQTGESLWSERFDRSENDVFAVQDEITLRVLVALEVTLSDRRELASRGAGTTDVDAYLGLMKAQKAFQNYTKDSMIEARRLLKQVRERDPDYYHALILEARTHTFDAQWGFSDDKLASLEAATELLREASLLDGNLTDAENAELNIAQAYIDQIAGKYENALSLALSAARNSPNNSELLATAGWVASFDRDYDRSISLLKNAIALNPVYPSWYANFISRDFTFKGQFEEAIAWSKTGVERAENDHRRAWALVNQAFAYAEAGRTDDAEAAGAAALQAWPDISIDTLKKAQPFRFEEDWLKFEQAMRIAGIDGGSG
ncbi:hypothetical protein [Hoeflea poritis]|uniref:Adenylate cyclase n=1 Tax=Hoeflea poritis TaxID=2993659 RepID=A0ABT4VUJ4_9HYPH|nr:hypothetical protein [Hoeflea poritis]MDA4848387.1 hypothetical protein [Hoeflea poritis]